MRDMDRSPLPIAAPRAASDATSSYWAATREPFVCLLLLLPLVLAYELGALIVHPESRIGQRLVAESFIRQMVAWVGTDAVWVPGVALLLTLLVWQVLSRKPWRVRYRVAPLMIVESLVLTLPLFVLRALSGPGVERVETLAGPVVLALGAGIYEELVFRFYLVSGLLWLLRRVCQVPRRAAMVSAIVLAALVFAVCHMQPIGAEMFAWPRLVALTAAGGYLAVVFIFRGLGVATGCHVAYNVLALVLGTE